MRFRGYYTPKGSYTVRYRALDKHIQDQFRSLLGSAGLDADVAATLQDHYKVVPTTNPTTVHENIMGKEISCKTRSAFFLPCPSRQQGAQAFLCNPN